jgi:hypothetical protein
MQDAIHAMPQLFSQLGLDDQPQAIDRFIREHPLPQEMKVSAAPFWSFSQREFLREALDDDSDWCELVDQLEVMLHNVTLH